MNKKFRMKHFVVLFIAVMLMMTASACETATKPAAPAPGNGSGSQSESASDKTPETAAPAAAHSWEIDTSPVELSVFVDTTGHDFQSNWGKDDISKKWIAETGVNLKWETAADPNHKKLNLYIASGKLPDIMIIPTDFSGTRELAKKNAIWSLNELAEKAGAPDFMNNFSKHILLDKRVSFDSMDFYAMPAFHTPEEGFDAPFVPKNMQGTIVNNNIYEELGSPAVKTGDDFISLLRKVKEKYPNLIPLESYRQPSPDNDGNPWLISMLLQHADLGEKYFEQDGGYVKYWQHPDFIKVLKFANQLYNEGLIDKTEFTDDKTKLQSKEYNGTIFAMLNEDADNLSKINNNLKKVQPDNHFKMVEPFALEAGMKFEADSLNGGFGEFNIVISKKSEHAERALRFLDYIAQPETQKELIFGLEGKGYTMKDGMPQLTPEYLEDEAKVGRNNSLYGNFNYYILRDNYWSPMAKYNSSEEIVKQGMEITNKYYQDFSFYLGADIFPANSEASKAGAQIKQYYRNEIMKIVIAAPNEVEDKYNNMIAQMNKLGLDKLNAYYTDYFKEKKQLMDKYDTDYPN